MWWIRVIITVGGKIFPTRMSKSGCGMSILFQTVLTTTIDMTRIEGYAPHDMRHVLKEFHGIRPRMPNHRRRCRGNLGNSQKVNRQVEYALGISPDNTSKHWNVGREIICPRILQ
jgi:hypothetical protein